MRRPRISRSMAAGALAGTLILGLSSAAAAQSDTDPSGAAQVDPDLQIYPTPPAKLVYSLHNDDFTVRVRRPGGPWRDLYEYAIKVDQTVRTTPRSSSSISAGPSRSPSRRTTATSAGSRSGPGVTGSRRR